MATKNSIGSNKPIEVPFGGTGIASTSTYSVFCGGTTSTNPLQQVSSLGTSGQVLTSQGAGALPVWGASGGGVPNYTGLTAFTPTINFTTGSVGLTANPANLRGYYIQIGALIQVYAFVELTAKGSSTGDFFIGNLPASTNTVPDDTQFMNGFLYLLSSSPSTVIQGTITTNPIGGGTAVRFMYPQNQTGSTTSFVNNTQIGNTTRFGFTGVYF
jgi:hypothetical protein